MDEQANNILPFQAKKVETKPVVKKKQNLLMRRVYAFTADLMLVTVSAKVLLYGYLYFLRTHMGMMDMQVQRAVFWKIPGIYFPVLLAVFCGYFWGSYYLGHGRSLGKVMLKLRVVPKNELRSINLQESLLRGAGYFLCYVTGLIPFGLAFLTSNNFGIPDYLSSTRVLDENEWQQMLAEKDQHQEKPAEIWGKAA